MDPLQEQFERAAGDAFFEWLNAETGASYSFARRAEQAPDLVYSFAGIELLVEVTAAYYDGPHAAFLWKGACNGKNAPSGWVGTNPDKSLAQEVANRISQKSKNRYGARCLLLVIVPPGVTSAEKLAELLAQQSIRDNTPFWGIYVAGRFPITSSSAGGYRVIPIKELPANPPLNRTRAG